MSDHHDEDVISTAHFFEEYWPLLVFGGLFTLTVFFPLLFLPPEAKGIFGWLVGVTAVLSVAILLGPTLLGGKAKK
ncbi:MAG: hypothetical protein KC476_00090 [Cyanobacteria bacterium HKST-UBA06]|nr:hypothetical protein [Cyanobacteria bacterium HKST-UBA04]MCA9806327.1 hypothetical protein [Cyanobacteria bacterium HKST-UBA06]MCA9840670.1 hypothetical protein [Cyanobacteria bacterium HKST-UBA03]